MCLCNCNCISLWAAGRTSFNKIIIKVSQNFYIKSNYRLHRRENKTFHFIAHSRSRNKPPPLNVVSGRMFALY